MINNLGFLCSRYLGSQSTGNTPPSTCRVLGSAFNFSISVNESVMFRQLHNFLVIYRRTLKTSFFSLIRTCNHQTVYKHIILEITPCYIMKHKLVIYNQSLSVSLSSSIKSASVIKRSSKNFRFAIAASIDSL